MKAVILAAGKGTRMGTLTQELPKPMLPVAGVPFTTHQIARAREAGVTRVVLGTSYRAEVFREHFGDGRDLGVDLVYVTEEHPLGTGGAIRHVAPFLDSGPHDPVLVFNGDVLSGVDIAGNVSGASSVQRTFAYDTNTQGGRTAATDAGITVVGIGLNTGQYVKATATIQRSVSNSVSLVAALERNYANPA